MKRLVSSLTAAILISSASFAEPTTETTEHLIIENCQLMAEFGEFSDYLSIMGKFETDDPIVRKVMMQMYPGNVQPAIDFLAESDVVGSPLTKREIELALDEEFRLQRRERGIDECIEAFSE